MKRKIQHMFALSEKGAVDLVKGTLWCALSNISLMFPVGLLVLVLDRMIRALSGGTNPAEGVWGYTAAGAAILAVIFLIYNFNTKASILLPTMKAPIAECGWLRSCALCPCPFSEIGIFPI